MSNIQSIEFIGEHETHDLELEHQDHQFYLENGVLTSNSHAVAYAIDSFWCAWLLTYYEKEWLTSYIEAMMSTPEKKIKAIAELKSFGYKIVPIDINYATKNWTCFYEEKKFMPSLLSCKGVGDAAVEEIMANRPYKSFEDVLYNEDGSWRLSKFNKRALDVLISVCAFDSLDCVGEDKLFSSYKHMYEVVITNNDIIKKSLKKDPFIGKKSLYSIARDLGRMPEWTKKELIEKKVNAFGNLDISTIVDDTIIEKLYSKGINPIDEWDGKGIYWFIVGNSAVKKTKNNTGYLDVDALGVVGNIIKLKVWGWDSDKTLNEYAIMLAEIDMNNFGYSTKCNKLKEIHL